MSKNKNPKTDQLIGYKNYIKSAKRETKENSTLDLGNMSYFELIESNIRLAEGMERLINFSEMLIDIIHKQEKTNETENF